MTKPRILVLCSTYYQDLAKQHLAHCKAILDRSPYDYTVEIVEAGTYEIPAVIRAYHENQPFDGYIPLSLLLKGSTDHYDFIFEHVKNSFIQFALQGILLGNAIITAPSLTLLEARVQEGARVQEAYNAVDYLIRLRSRIRLFTSETSWNPMGFAKVSLQSTLCCL